MTATLKTNLAVKDVCEGFVYNKLAGKGLFGWGGRLCKTHNRAKGNR